jgi:hypothetical protein
METENEDMTIDGLGGSIYANGRPSSCFTKAVPVG